MQIWKWRWKEVVVRRMKGMKGMNKQWSEETKWPNPF